MVRWLVDIHRGKAEAPAEQWIADRQWRDDELAVRRSPFAVSLSATVSSSSSLTSPGTPGTFASSSMRIPPTVSAGSDKAVVQAVTSDIRATMSMSSVFIRIAGGYRVVMGEPLARRIPVDEPLRKNLRRML